MTQPAACARWSAAIEAMDRLHYRQSREMVAMHARQSAELSNLLRDHAGVTVERQTETQRHFAPQEEQQSGPKEDADSSAAREERTPEREQGGQDEPEAPPDDSIQYEHDIDDGQSKETLASPTAAHPVPSASPEVDEMEMGDDDQHDQDPEALRGRLFNLYTAAEPADDSMTEFDVWSPAVATDSEAERTHGADEDAADSAAPMYVDQEPEDSAREFRESRGSRADRRRRARAAAIPASRFDSIRNSRVSDARLRDLRSHIDKIRASERKFAASGDLQAADLYRRVRGDFQEIIFIELQLRRDERARACNT